MTLFDSRQTIHDPGPRERRRHWSRRRWGGAAAGQPRPPQEAPSRPRRLGEDPGPGHRRRSAIRYSSWENRQGAECQR